MEANAVIMNVDPSSDLSPPAPVVVCVAPNGARRTHRDHPALPISPDELARDALACADAGASVLHLHVRDDADAHSLDATRYRNALAAIDAAVGDRLLVQVTTEAVGRYTLAQQMVLLHDLRPRAASFALRELAPTPADDDAAARHLAWAHQAGVALQYILYSAEDAARLEGWIARGWVAEPRPNVLFVLGRYTQGQRSDPTDLLPFLAGDRRAWTWSVCAFGPTEAQCMAAAVGLGGHVRVGFENNLWRRDGRPVRDNAELVANAVALAQAAGRPAARVDQAVDSFNVRRDTLSQ